MKVFAKYIPNTDGNLVIWAGTYKEKLGLLGPGLGLTATEIEEQQMLAQAVIDGINKVDLKRVEMKEATTAKDLLKQTHLQLIRAAATRIKTLPAYTPNAGKELGIAASSHLVDENELKPMITATSYAGYVSLGFNKQGMFGISLYSRLKGQQEWNLLGTTKTAPFTDDSPLAEEGRPEVREYRAVYYDGLDEIGRASDIITIIHGG